MTQYRDFEIAILTENWLGVVHKGRPQKMTNFLLPTPCPHLTNPHPTPSADVRTR